MAGTYGMRSCSCEVLVAVLARTADRPVGARPGVGRRRLTHGIHGQGPVGGRVPAV